MAVPDNIIRTSYFLIKQEQEKQKEKSNIWAQKSDLWLSALFYLSCYHAELASQW